MKRSITLVSIILLAFISIFLGYAFRNHIFNNSPKDIINDVATNSHSTSNTLSLTVNTKPAATNIPSITAIPTNTPIPAASNSPVPTNKIQKSESKLTLVKSSNKEFDIYSNLNGNSMLLTRFDKKDWGTWNIGGWLYSNHHSSSPNDYELLAGGGTDWEYVFRVSQSGIGTLDFSGGNHGKELLKSIKLVFGKDEVNLDKLKIGEKKQLNDLTIYESTSLAFDDNSKNRYANVLRKYTILPSKITLETNFEFTAQTFMGTSYVCMFPVSKSFGRYAKFIDSGNTYKTPPTGQTLTAGSFENYLGKEKTMSVEMWGDAKPSFKFDVRIDNAGMVNNFNNKLKVFYWDLNRDTNKLYFSKYDSENLQKIPAGTKWSNKAEWEFRSN